MGTATYYQPIEAILDGNCNYEYYNHTAKTFSKTSRTRICHVELPGDNNYNKDIALLIFTIRNQNDAWKIHSEGIKRTDSGAMVPLRNATVNLAKEKGWKFIAVAVVGDDTPNTENISQYVVSIESYTYGDETVGVLTEALQELEELGNPEFHRIKVDINGKEYSLAFIKKECFVSYLTYFDDRPYNKPVKRYDFDCSTIKGDGINKIFYGVPGCGKSHYIEHDILGKNKDTKQYGGDFSKDNIIRTTFYQDYSNTDFVGQILPKIVKGEDGDDVVEYVFNPGPFTLALIQAISNPTKKVALVVEEINRGNAPAIFGDIFQLLDRDENGISEYGIVNVGVLDYLKTVNFGTESEPLYYSFKDIKIPGNMHIYATMNTSDQNVYTLDTAFTRRWSKERIPNEFNGNAIASMLVPGMKDCTWADFVERINRRIKDRLDDLQVNEDKQIGCFFVKKMDLLLEGEIDEGKKKAQAFAYKVLEYLWDDVSKLDHAVIFDTNLKTFEDLVKKYVSSGEKVFASNIFAINQEELLESND